MYLLDFEDDMQAFIREGSSVSDEFELSKLHDEIQQGQIDHLGTISILTACVYF